MESRVFYLSFKGLAHFGAGLLQESALTFAADTLFAALFIEALKQGREEELLRAAQGDKLFLSDALPYQHGELFLPKPLLKIEHAKSYNPAERKLYKKLSHLPLSAFAAYLKGSFDVKAHPQPQFAYKVPLLRGRARPLEEATGYYVGALSFRPGCGLAFIAVGADAAVLALIEDLLASLALSGIGGKRSQGLGQFAFKSVKNPPLNLQLCCGRVMEDVKPDDSTARFMLLNAALPRPDELPAVMPESSYLLIKRSGFVSLGAGSGLKRRELFFMQAGSCVSTRFAGDVYDAALDAPNPVWRFAKPLFVRIPL